eukprot:COSAG01_NODE_3640_length_5838_cov_4.263286_3_plen_327_part_00
MLAELYSGRHLYYYYMISISISSPWGARATLWCSAASHAEMVWLHVGSDTSVPRRRSSCRTCRDIASSLICIPAGVSCAVPSPASAQTHAHSAGAQTIATWREDVARATAAVWPARRRPPVEVARRTPPPQPCGCAEGCWVCRWRARSHRPRSARGRRRRCQCAAAPTLRPALRHDGNRHAAQPQATHKQHKPKHSSPTPAPRACHPPRAHTARPHNRRHHRAHLVAIVDLAVALLLQQRADRRAVGVQPAAVEERALRRTGRLRRLLPPHRVPEQLVRLQGAVAAVPPQPPSAIREGERALPHKTRHSNECSRPAAMPADEHVCV